MPVRATMANLILRTRLLINDPPGASQVFTDQDIQNVLDESRADLYNQPLIAQPTFSGATILYLDYLSPTQLGDWEDDIVLKQYMTVVVTPSLIDDIVGHYTFAQSTFPPVYITGKTYDLYRSAADLLVRMAARWAMRFNATADGQTLHLEGVSTQLLNLAKQYRMKQRIGVTTMTRSDLQQPAGASSGVNLDPRPIDYMGSG